MIHATEFEGLARYLAATGAHVGVLRAEQRHEDARRVVQALPRLIRTIRECESVFVDILLGAELRAAEKLCVQFEISC
jgi:hypothetical protein